MLRVVVVARADRPDGAALAEEFAGTGAGIVLTGDDVPALSALASSLQDRFATRVAVAPGAADSDAVREMTEELFARH
jgi:hypothetical protein